MDKMQTSGLTQDLLNHDILCGLCEFAFLKRLSQVFLVDTKVGESLVWDNILNWKWRARNQDGRGIGRGDHFLFYKFIERTRERWTKFTKQLLIASSGHQAPRKAAHFIRREAKKFVFLFFFLSFFFFFCFSSSFFSFFFSFFSFACFSLLFPFKVL